MGTTSPAPAFPLEHFERLGTHVVDTRTTPPDLFVDESATDWRRLTWRELGLYAYENGFDVLRAGYVKAHNGVVAKAR